MDQQPNQNMQPEQPNPQPQKLLNRTWQIAAIVAAGILVVGGAAYGSYYLWQKSAGNISQNTNQNQFAGVSGASPSPSVSVSASPSASPDETAGWQTYKNDKYGYSIKYPEKYFVRLICLNEELLLIKREANDVRNNLDMGNCGRDGKYKFEVRTSTKAFSPPQSNEYWSVISKSIKIDNKVGIEYTVEQIKEYQGPSTRVGEKEYYAYVESNGKYFEIYFGGKELSEYFDQILSTFKFIDPIADSLSKASATEGRNTLYEGWLNYKDEKCGLELKYPPAWLITDNSNYGGAAHPDECRLFITTEVHQSNTLNKAGSLDESPQEGNAQELLKAMESTYASRSYTQSESDFSGVNVAGKYFTDSAPDGSITEYFYIFQWDKKILVIFFQSYPQQAEKLISSELKKTIDSFVKTLKKL